MRNSITAVFALLVACTGIAVNAAEKPPHSPFELSWHTVANNGVAVPDDPAGRPFNSFNPPSVNSAGFVVLRGRSRGPEPPASGIFARDMSSRSDGTLYRIASRAAEVPAPNNTAATFNEFPSFPRVALNERIVATRGNSEPVWQYATPQGDARAGTSGVFAAVDGVNLGTAFSQLGTVPGFEQFLVPGIGKEAAFDQFPGAPSLTDDGILLTKGNYSINGVRHTGIFFRDLFSGDASVQLLVNTATQIPGVRGALQGLAFGSTAPPSAAKGTAAFVAYDNEAFPSLGGIYLAKIRPQPPLQAMAELGEEVPGVGGAVFLRFGEGLSFNGRHVAYWGSWGTDTRTVRLHCPTEGNKDRIGYCRDTDPDTNRGTNERWQEKQLPVNQGIFVTDIRNRKSRLIARTGDTVDDFLYWTYSGHPPGTGGGHDDAEPPRWRFGAYFAVASLGGADFAVTFKGRSGKPDADTNVYMDFVDGIYLRRGPGSFPLITVFDTTQPGTVLDSEAPDQSIISEIGIERDGFRGTYLAISASMSGVGPYVQGATAVDDEATWAGVYLAEVPAAFGR